MFDVAALANRITGQMLTDPRYTYADTRLIADVVRATVADVNAELCAQMDTGDALGEDAGVYSPLDVMAVTYRAKKLEAELSKVDTGGAFGVGHSACLTKTSDGAICSNVSGFAPLSILSKSYATKVLLNRCERQHNSEEAVDE